MLIQVFVDAIVIDTVFPSVVDVVLARFASTDSDYVYACVYWISAVSDVAIEEKFHQAMEDTAAGITPWRCAVSACIAECTNKPLTLCIDSTHS